MRHPSAGELEFATELLDADHGDLQLVLFEASTEDGSAERWAGEVARRGPARAVQGRTVRGQRCGRPTRKQCIRDRSRLLPDGEVAGSGDRRAARTGHKRGQIVGRQGRGGIVRPVENSRREKRSHVVEVAAELLREHGPSAVTTRAVATEAGVQPPAIYRLFGDKEGLLDAVAEHVFAAYVADKALHEDGDDPVADLRAAWDAHVDFGLSNAALFGLLSVPGRSRLSPAAAGLEVLRARVHRVAEAGRLRVMERRAVELIQSAGTGVVLTLLALPSQDRGLDLAGAMCDAVMQSVLTDMPALARDGGTTGAAVAFRAVVPQLMMLTGAERALMAEWLDRATER